MFAKIKKGAPWWVKIGAKIVLARLPISYRFWQSVGLFRHGFMDAANYALNVFDTHVARAGLRYEDLKGKTVLEIGPGDSVATAIIACAYGAESILIDSGPWAKDSALSYVGLVRLLSERGLDVPQISGDENLVDILNKFRGRYIPAGIRGWAEIEDGKVDFVFSQAVLEHVRKSEFLETQKECWRVMANGAIASHRVDLRDHLGGSLDNLRFSEKLWESDFFVRSGFYTNRIQKNQMIRFFVEAGFECEVIGESHWDQLPTSKRKMNNAFHNIPDEELCVSGFDVLLKKTT